MTDQGIVDSLKIAFAEYDAEEARKVDRLKAYNWLKDYYRTAAVQAKDLTGTWVELPCERAWKFPVAYYKREEWHIVNRPPTGYPQFNTGH